jgi:hypothetical protein
MDEVKETRPLQLQVDGQRALPLPVRHVQLAQHLLRKMLRGSAGGAPS